MQVAAAQSVIMLATTHLLPEDLHPDLLRFMSGRGPLPSTQQGSPPQQALRNVVVLERDLPDPEPSPARPRPNPYSGVAAQTRQSCLLSIIHLSPPTASAQDGISNSHVLVSTSISDAACCERTEAHDRPLSSADALPKSCGQQQRSPAQRVQAAKGQPGQRAAPVQQLCAEQALSRPNAAELDRQKALQQKVLLPTPKVP